MGVGVGVGVDVGVDVGVGVAVGVFVGVGVGVYVGVGVTVGGGLEGVGVGGIVGKRTAGLAVDEGTDVAVGPASWGISRGSCDKLAKSTPVSTRINTARST